ncbi:MAG: restriction endonuclease [Verrucomicrobiota bacterium]
MYLLLALLVVKAGYEVFFLNNPNRRKSSESDKGNPDEQEILRKFRRWEFRKRRKASDELRKQQEWWRGIDGRGFELGVAKVLLEKGYNVKHTGSSWGDEGVDLVLVKDSKKIIIQCKAHKSYVSAGPVRELYGTLMHQKADEAWLVVTSGFYIGARTFAYGKPIRLLTAWNLMNLPPIRPISMNS